MGFTSLIVASGVTLFSGLALAICLRELFMQVTQSPRSFEKSLKKDHDRLLGDRDRREYVIEDSRFEAMISRRAHELSGSGTAVMDRASYLGMISFLAFVALAGVLAGLSHFA